VRPIQDALGITDGGVAGNVFSGLPEGVDSWPTLSEDDRRRWLGEFWDLETVPDTIGFAAANDLVGKPNVEVREATGEKCQS
jgi:hypothetical protein